MDPIKLAGQKSGWSEDQRSGQVKSMFTDRGRERNVR